MALKDLMVHLDPGERTAARVELAVGLARTHDARLTGLFGQRALAEQVGVVAKWPSAAYVEAARASEAMFARATAGLRQVEWRDVNRGSDAELIRLITTAARCADLFVLGQHDEAAEALVPPSLANELIVHSGRPVLVVPYAGTYTSPGRRPLIAWDDTRESARALDDALPLIAGCTEAIVVSLDAPYESALQAVAEVARHLACHGITARSEVLVAEEGHVMDAVLNRISELDADLLVIGAHRHAALPVGRRPADPRAILTGMVVPALVAR